MIARFPFVVMTLSLLLLSCCSGFFHPFLSVIFLSAKALYGSGWRFTFRTELDHYWRKSCGPTLNSQFPASFGVSSFVSSFPGSSNLFQIAWLLSTPPLLMSSALELSFPLDWENRGHHGWSPLASYPLAKIHIDPYAFSAFLYSKPAQPSVPLVTSTPTALNLALLVTPPSLLSHVFSVFLGLYAHLYLLS